MQWAGDVGLDALGTELVGGCRANRALGRRMMGGVGLVREWAYWVPCGACEQHISMHVNRSMAC